MEQESSLKKSMVYIPSKRIVDLASYDLPPPEAGPLSTQLNESANELIKKNGSNNERNSWRCC